MDLRHDLRGSRRLRMRSVTHRLAGVPGHGRDARAGLRDCLLGRLRMAAINWGTWLAAMVLMAVVAFVIQRYPQYVWPWGVLAYTLLFVASVVWAVVDHQRRRSKR